MSLGASDLLAAWEDGTAQHPIQRGLTLLAAAWPELPEPVLSQMSIGQRDGALLTLREQLFGPLLAGLALCPHCREQLDLAFQVDDIRAPLPPADAAAGMASATQPGFHLAVDGYQVQYRLPTSADLLAVAAAGDAVAAHQALLQRCVLALQQDGVDATGPALAGLPDFVAQALAAQMEAADPQGNVQLALDCPACGHHWLQTFDILTYLWREIDDWAQRTLREVHLLASAYGWSEPAILGLSARRRHIYLEMVLG
ncbi:MAG: phage baseplate protein [Anaerolineae bacterium]|nr:phage baseplate protein [Anaerolineae bacterium]MCB0231262.1 phage baseplate protein [Anaerolineae bacterium]MCB0240413.1 phage baseplate protein [Anaerolineae bacterium]MCB0245544.1 phage baseplate protein [Anaerolineae bacterium]MCB0249817.1 phage baseplate protein [Anaerolineae bacterium]